MTLSRRQANGNARLRIWLRRGHRWLGVVLVLFVLLLGVSGIALNHASDWGLDRRHLDWPWLLDAYGIQAPAPTASFADGDLRATLIGERLFLDDEEIAEGVTGLAGLATLAAVNALLFLALRRGWWAARPAPTAPATTISRLITEASTGRSIEISEILTAPLRSRPADRRPRIGRWD